MSGGTMGQDPMRGASRARPHSPARAQIKAPELMFQETLVAGCLLSSFARGRRSKGLLAVSEALFPTQPATPDDSEQELVPAPYLVLTG